MSQSPTKVLRIITRLIVGGPTWHVVHLSQGLEAAYPTLLVTGEAGPAEADVTAAIRNSGIPVHVIPGLGREIRLLADLRVAFALYRLMRRVSPAIVHTHTAKAGTLGRIAAIVAGVPVRVHTFHGHTFRGYFSPLKTGAAPHDRALVGSFQHLHRGNQSQSGRGIGQHVSGLQARQDSHRAAGP